MSGARYVFGLLFTDATLDYLRDYEGEETTQIYRDLRHFFGTVPAPRSCFKWLLLTYIEAV